MQMKHLQMERQRGLSTLTPKAFNSRKGRVSNAMHDALNDLYVWQMLETGKTLDEVKLEKGDINKIWQCKMPWESESKRTATEADVLYYGKRALPLLEERNRTFEELRLLKAEAVRTRAHFEELVDRLQSAAAVARAQGGGISRLLEIHLSRAQQLLSNADTDLSGFG